jgi:hypothetical protein
VSLNDGLLYNRGEFRLNFLPPSLTFRVEVLDRRPLNAGFGSLSGGSEKAVTNYLGALYHKTTGSRVLFGALDEQGLPARIRNPWIRSPPFAESRKPLAADLKTSVSATKNDEAYLYLSSPFLNVFQSVGLKGFISAQTETREYKPAFAGGVELSLPDKAGITLETFYITAALPETKAGSWFSDPPRLPEREFKLFAAGLFFHNRLLSVSSDFAFSETFAWGADIYCNFAVNFTLPSPFGSRRQTRPLSFSFSAEGAGKKFVYRDGANHAESFRSAAKIEWKGSYNSLLRLNTTLRAPVFGGSFNRSSTGFYYRFPSKKPRGGNNFPLRLTRISLTADRNADNPQKTSDKFTGNIGLLINLNNILLNTPLALNISGSISTLAEAGGNVPPFPVPEKNGTFDKADINCEFTWSPSNFQFKSKVGFINNFKKEEGLWEFSLSAALSFKYGRLSVKAASPDFPGKWNLTVSWRLETGTIELPRNRRESLEQ